MVGTEAVLQRIDRADVVAFLDLDQELLAPRYRAAEQALALVARAARVVAASAAPGARAAGRLLLQTRLPDHEVVQAAVRADVGPVAEAEQARRALLRFPPDTAMAEVSGPAAPAFIELLGAPIDVEVVEAGAGRWWLRAPDHQTLCDALAATRRPPGRLRIEVDPLRCAGCRLLAGGGLPELEAVALGILGPGEAAVVVLLDLRTTRSPRPSRSRLMAASRSSTR